MKGCGLQLRGAIMCSSVWKFSFVLDDLRFPLRPLFPSLSRERQVQEPKLFYLVNMPKDRRTRSMSFERSAPAPYSLRSSIHQRGSSSLSQHLPEPVASDAEIKEWEEARCPVCMDHPHNAVLLLCSSHDRGCCTYMCDTSYRHSNCLDQFRKASSSSAACQGSKGDNEEALNLLCPLCRGGVKDWVVVDAARHYMNAKSRACSLETCEYSGTYGELRKHARLEHPSVRPSDTDPERQRDWRRMERQHDIGDLLSTIQPLINEREAAIFGNGDEVGIPAYVIPRLLISLSVRIPRQAAIDRAPSLQQVIISFAPMNEPTPRSQRRRSQTQWGENFDGELDLNSGDGIDYDEENSPSAEVHYTTARRPQSQHRRRMWMPDDEDIA